MLALVAVQRSAGRTGACNTNHAAPRHQLCEPLPILRLYFHRCLPPLSAVPVPAPHVLRGDVHPSSTEPFGQPRVDIHTSDQLRYQQHPGPRVPTATTTQTIRPGERSAHHRRRRRHCRTTRAPSTAKEVRGSRAASRLGHARVESLGSRSSTLVAVEVFGPRAARLDPSSAQLPRG